MGFFFLKTDICAGGQKTSLSRKKKPKTSSRKKRPWAVSVQKQSSITYRPVSVLSARELRGRMSIIGSAELGQGAGAERQRFIPYKKRFLFVKKRFLTFVTH